MLVGREIVPIIDEAVQVLNFDFSTLIYGILNQKYNLK
jgi:hypothetical protein